MTEVVMGEYASVIVSVSEEKTKSLSWFLGVIRKECGDSGKSFAKTWMEAQQSAIGR